MKRNRLEKAAYDECRAPYGARGLKPKGSAMNRMASTPRPVRGAWVETLVVANDPHRHLSPRPVRGAWVETRPGTL